MQNDNLPNPNIINPIPNLENMIYVKPTIKNPNIIVGDYTYFADVDFETHVTHHYDFNGDKLIIGKFCQIAAGVNFIMNGANHQMNSVSTYPFYIFEGWEQEIPSLSKMPLKGDTIVGNDVWIGQNVTIMPGVLIALGHFQNILHRYARKRNAAQLALYYCAFCLLVGRSYVN